MRRGSRAGRRPVVAHVHQRYLPISQTFVHRLIAGLRRYAPVVITESLENEDSYHFGRDYVVRPLGKRHELLYRVLAKAVRIGRPSLRPYWPIHARHTCALVGCGAALIHAHFGTTGWLCLPLQKLHGLPLIVSFHGQDATALALQTPWRSRFAELFAAVDAITVPSYYIGERLAQAGCSMAKIHVVRCGLDLTAWSLRSADHQGGSDIRVLMVGRLVEKKGVAYAIRAISQIIGRMPNVHMRVVGDGPLRGELQSLITNLNIARHVELLGSRPNAEVATLMRESDVLVVPSVTAADGDEEGLPVVLVEAAATGLPVVATNHSGIPEIVEDGVSGFIVPQRDVPALADRLAELLGNSHLREAMGQAARRAVEREFGLDRSVEQVEDLYRLVLV